MPTVEINLQPKQEEGWQAFNAEWGRIVLYGGAKFAGKSHLVRAAQVNRRLDYPGTRGVIFRKTYDELLSNHVQPFIEEYPFLLKCWRANSRSFIWPNGSITEFRYLNREMDVYRYAGIEYADITVDEITQHHPVTISILATSARLSPALRARYPDLTAKILLTGNPGGIGHSEVQRLFIERQFKEEEDPDDYYFVQARYTDNPIGVQANPAYVRSLNALPEDLRKGLRDGDWSIFAGQYMRKLNPQVHLVDPFKIPDTWYRFRSMDWGYAHNTVVLWWAVAPNGTAFIYRHLVFNRTVPDKAGRRIVEATPEGERIETTVAGTDLWARLKEVEKTGFETIADIFESVGVACEPAITDRVQGWTRTLSLIEWDATRKPELLIFRTSDEVYRGLSLLLHDDKNPEDVQKMDGDDIGDAVRYGVQHVYSYTLKKDPLDQLDPYRTLEEPLEGEDEGWEVHDGGGDW